MKDNKPVETLGLDHVGLTVKKLKETASFFVEQPDWKIIGDMPDCPAIIFS